MHRPKILDVNGDSGAPVYCPYNVMLNKCSGSCNDLDNPMTKLCVPDITKNANMKVYNLLMQANETKHVLWHETCKCICQSTSAVCNSKQIWNSETCSCDCNEDFAAKMVYKKGYMWNPSTCACECDMWCKPVDNGDGKSIYIGLFSLFFAYFKWIKGKNLFEKGFENKHFNDVSEIDDDY